MSEVLFTQPNPSRVFIEGDRATSSDKLRVTPNCLHNLLACCRGPTPSPRRAGSTHGIVGGAARVYAIDVEEAICARRWKTRFNKERRQKNIYVYMRLAILVGRRFH